MKCVSCQKEIPDGVQFCKDRTLPEFMGIVESICCGRYWLEKPRNKKFLVVMGVCSAIPFLILSF